MSSTVAHRDVRIREMNVEDIPDVYHLGNLLFHGPTFTTLYRTWDAFEVTGSYNQDPELCLVAEASDSRVVGFALGTTYEKEMGAWKYGQIVWLGVKPDYQETQVGSKLYREMERRMRNQGVRMVIMDTASSNKRAVKFFKSMGFGKPRYQIWMSKVLKKADTPGGQVI
jgi:ribosomal protein S18 acetylase RimI-like enzyme